MLQWLRRRRQAELLAQADAEALVRDHGAEAYREARERERDVILPNGTTHAGRTPAHWRRVALVVAKRTGRKVGLDTASRMAIVCAHHETWDRNSLRQRRSPGRPDRRSYRRAA